MSNPPSQSEPLFTLQVSKRGAWLLVLIIVCVLIFAVIRTRENQIIKSAVEPTVPTNTLASGIANNNAPTPESISPKQTADVPRASMINHVENVKATYVIPQEQVAAQVAEISLSHDETIENSQQIVIAPTIAHNVKLTVPRPADGPINGAGATFPRAIYSRWFSEYHKLRPETEFRYEAIGSGGGVRQVLSGAVDFGASDIPISDEQLSRADISVLHIPTVLGAVVPIYNVFGVGELRFTPEILAGIYLGKITSWSDPAILRANPGQNLPARPIVVVHRSDGNAATFIFTDYLSKVSPEWNDLVGKGTSVKWPVGFGGKGNEGVAGEVHQLDGAIGYVDLLYAEHTGISFGSVRNAAGRFVKANLANVTEAGATVREIPADFRVSITNSPGANAYPISSFTWLLVPNENDDRTKQRELASFLKWMITNGQTMTGELGYAPLPRNIIFQLSKRIEQIR